MNEFERHERILAMLGERPFSSVRDLQAAIGVSGATIRRDIDRLDGLGRARKVYGGVAALETISQRHSTALPFVENRDIAVIQKQAIARRAAELVRDGSLIIVHGGSTCFHFGVEIAHRSVRVFTNSHPLASYLGEKGTCQLTVGGGDLHREPGIFYDAGGAGYTFYASQFFVGGLGVGPGGILEQHPLLVRFTNEMSQLSNEVIVLVDSRKFDARPPTVALPLTRVSRLVTDDGLSEEHAKMLEDHGVDFIIATARSDA